MSSLAFLSKKSWHTGLQVNQERVWKAEKAALAERRKVEEVRKERDREREMQELERLQEENGGKKRQEKVDWMYSAPASGSNVDKNELEDYLLGKKRVDKLLQGEEKSSLSRQGVAGAAASAGPPQAGSSTDAAGLTGIASDRDVASKIREDPMLAIRQQEQAAYQALLRDPARLRAMRKAAGLPDKEGESKEERRRRKEEKRQRREADRYDSRDSREPSSRSHRRRDDDDVPRRRYDEDDRRRSPRRRYDGDDRERRSHQSADRDERNGRSERRYDSPPKSSERGDYRDRYADSRRPARTAPRDDYDRRQRYTGTRHDEYRSETRPARGSRSRSRSPLHARTSAYADRRNDTGRANEKSSVDDAAATRAAKLAAMQQNAASVSSERKAWLDKVQAEEAEENARNEALRTAALASKAKGRGKDQEEGGFGNDNKGRFVAEQERSLYGAGSGMDLAERLRSRNGLQRFRDD